MVTVKGRKNPDTQKKCKGFDIMMNEKILNFLEEKASVKLTESMGILTFRAMCDEIRHIITVSKTGVENILLFTNASAPVINNFLYTYSFLYENEYKSIISNSADKENAREKIANAYITFSREKNIVILQEDDNNGSILNDCSFDLMVFSYIHYLTDVYYQCISRTIATDKDDTVHFGRIENFILYLIENATEFSIIKAHSRHVDAIDGIVSNYISACHKEGNFYGESKLEKIRL